MGVSDIPKSGRELAIEALIDLDDRGPAFRVGRVLAFEFLRRAVKVRIKAGIELRHVGDG